MRSYLSAAEAAAELGVSVPTLYAYVSRGLLRSEGEGCRRYIAEDVWLLKERKQQRQDPAKARCLHWACRCLESRLTVIHDGRLYCRTRGWWIAGRRTIEQVASPCGRAISRRRCRPIRSPGRDGVEGRVAPRSGSAAPRGLQLFLPLAAARSVAFDPAPWCAPGAHPAPTGGGGDGVRPTLDPVARVL